MNQHLPQHKPRREDAHAKELTDLRSKNKLLERQNRRLTKELSKVMHTNDAFTSEPRTEDEVRQAKNSDCCKCGGATANIDIAKADGTRKVFVVCRTCKHREVML
jgi:hypothetical protein